jgi:hypothetical protein
LRLRDVGDAVGLDATRLGDLERGDRLLDQRALRVLSQFYAVSAEQLTVEMARWLERRGPRVPWSRNTGGWVRS